MTRATYEAMHREIEAEIKIDASRRIVEGLAKRLGWNAAERQRFIERCPPLWDVDDDKVVQGPW